MAKPKATVMVAQTANVKNLEYSEGMTADDAIKAAGMSAGEGVQVRLNGQPLTELNSPLKAGDVLMLVGNTSGGALK
jgi:sulfur carrier protein ThiS